MALELKRAAVNSAVDTLVTAMDDLSDGLAAAEIVLWVDPVVSERALNGAAPAAPVFPTDPKLSTTHVYQAPLANSNNSNIWHLPCPKCGYPSPIVRKCTNAAGELS